MPTIYGSPALMRAYFNERGLAFPSELTNDDSANEFLLIASEWLDNRYRSMFPGLKTGLRAQEREWPRTGANDIYGYVILNDEIPKEILQATYIATLKEANSPGALSVDWTPNKYKTASVDGAVSVEYVIFSNAAEIQTSFTAINEILSLLLSDRSSFSMLSGDAARV